MSDDKNTDIHAPLRPATQVFAAYEVLVALCRCWEEARGDKMIPSKHDFEAVMLNYPEILPSMTMVELLADGKLQYLFIGSERVFQMNKDQTRRGVESSFAVEAWKYTSDWMQASFEQPHVAFWKSRAHLPSGAIAQNNNLSVVLSDDSGVPRYTIIITVFDEAHANETTRGGYLIGSAGMEMSPIDIGYGVPDLPLRCP